MEKFFLHFVASLLFSMNFTESESVFLEREYLIKDALHCPSIGSQCPEKADSFDYQPIPDSVYCTEEYEPVCGKIQVQCLRHPCNPVYETFPNRCYAKKAGATDIRKGPCESTF